MKPAMRLYTTIIMTLVVCVQLGYTETEVDSITDNYRTRGVNLFVQGKYSDAIESFKKAIKINPDYAYAHYNLGRNYYILAEYQKAIKSCKQMIRINPDYADAHMILGMIYNSTGDRGNALEEYKVLMKLDKERANTLFDIIYK